MEHQKLWIRWRRISIPKLNSCSSSSRYVITKEIIFEVTCTYTILIIYVSIVSWDHKNLKHGHERYNLDNKNLATML
jgi:hypothetical protein